jgi:hypothetical protein
MSDESEIDYFKPWQLDVVLFIERVHSVTGALPVDSDILEYLRLNKKHQVTLGQLEELKTDSRFKLSLNSRGIPVDKELSPRQMAAASVMLNLTDRRSDEKKLRDLGISTEEFANWMQNNQFAEYMRARSEAMIANSVHEAHMGLMRGVKQGNTASIKLYYEMTNRYNPNQETQINVNLVIGRVIEVIQKYVKEPAVLNQLAVELSGIAIEAGSPINSHTQAIKGELM